MASDGVSARIELYLSELRLPSIRSSYRKIAKQINEAGGDYAAFLHALLEEEVGARRSRRIERRIKESRLPQVKELGDLEEAALPKGIKRERLFELSKGEYIEERANVIAIGGSGTGKTHVAIGLAVEACRQSRRVRFATATDLVSELEEAQEQHQLHRYLKRWATLDLVVVDELGYLPVTEKGAELLFQAFSARHERGSTIVTTNLPFADWAKVFKTERLAVAMLDRVTHRAHILEMNGESYRLRSAKRRTNKGQ